MSKAIKYSEAVYFRALCDSLLNGTLTWEAFDHSIERRIKSINQMSGGYWQIPKGETAFAEDLALMRRLHHNQVDKSVLYQIGQQISKKYAMENARCKIVFFAQELFVWPCVEHLYNMAVQDPRFDAKVVYLPFYHPNTTYEDSNLQEYKKRGVPIINYQDYNLTEDNPEIAVYVKPYNNIPPAFFMREVEKIVKRTIYIPYGLEFTKDLIRYAFHEYVHYRAWKHLAYGNIVKELGAIHGYRDGENIAVWGHPRVDNHLIKCDYSIPEEWKAKIADRKVVLWCPHHTIKPGPECVSTWLDYYQDVFRMFEEREDLVLLWRPHPLLFGAIVNNDYMSQREFDAFIAEKVSRNNVLLDRTDDYRTAFSISDAIITDGTTFALEYLLTGKSLMLTAHKLDQFYNYEKLGKSVYWAKCVEDIASFLDSISLGQDPKRELREAFANEMFFIPNGQSVSSHILNQILSEIQKEEIEW